MSETSQHVLDTTGLRCPEPVMLMHNRIRDMAAGEELLVVATDPSTQRDIPDFCRFLGHELLEQTVLEGSYRYRVRKREAT